MKRVNAPRRFAKKAVACICSAALAAAFVPVGSALAADKVTLTITGKDLLTEQTSTLKQIDDAASLAVTDKVNILMHQNGVYATKNYVPASKLFEGVDEWQAGTTMNFITADSDGKPFEKRGTVVEVSYEDVTAAHSFYPEYVNAAEAENATFATGNAQTGFEPCFALTFNDGKYGDTGTGQDALDSIGSEYDKKTVAWITGTTDANYAAKKLSAGYMAPTGVTALLLNHKHIIKAAEVSDLADVTYTGAAITPDVTVKVGDKTLVKDTDYTVAYSNNTEVGEASVTVTGKGDKVTGTVTKKFKINAAPVEELAKGAAEKVSAGTVKVLDASKDTVAYTNAAKASAKSVSVPATVKLSDGKTYTVTTVAKGAFKNMKKLKSVTFGKNVTKVAKGAFANTPKLSKITFKSTKLKKSGVKNALKGSKTKAKKVTVKVPKSKRSAYKKFMTKKVLGSPKAVAVK